MIEAALIEVEAALLRLKAVRLREEKGPCHYCRVPMFTTWGWNAGLNRWDKNYKRGEPAKPDEATKDHVIPASRGGRGLPYNKVKCCFDCNQKRGTKDYLTFKMSFQAPYP